MGSYIHTFWYTKMSCEFEVDFFDLFEGAFLLKVAKASHQELPVKHIKRSQK